MAKLTVVISDTTDGTVDVVRTKVFPVTALTDPITPAGMLAVVVDALAAQPELVEMFYVQYTTTLESEMEKVGFVVDGSADESTTAAAQ
ncbi:MAG: hypothetical protein IPO08_18335 [Xanthomonadales bacterium]|nr:hypothetical protein [Xanthomonadales bacterium]